MNANASSFLTPATGEELELRSILQSWVDEGSRGRLADSRQVAMHKILDCWRSGKKNLVLAELALSSLPPVMYFLLHLERMNVAYNNLVELPEGIDALDCLKELNISYNQIQQIPEEVGKLPLEVLQAQSNRLVGVPKSILTLPRSCFVNLEHNPLSKNVYLDLKGMSKSEGGPNLYLSVESVAQRECS
jgi:hypothetical protein